MPEFLLDFTASGTARVTGDSLADVVAAFKGFLDCYDPGVTLAVDGVNGAVTELSLGLCKQGQPVLAVAEVDGESADSGADADAMMTPVLCRRWAEDRDCEQVYDEARGDGYQGLCPHCADAKGC